MKQTVKKYNTLKVAALASEDRIYKAVTFLLLTLLLGKTFNLSLNLLLGQ